MRDYFDQINFKKDWDESDWKQFLDAQDLWLKTEWPKWKNLFQSTENRKKHPLSFTNVCRQFGINQNLSIDKAGNSQSPHPKRKINPYMSNDDVPDSNSDPIWRKCTAFSLACLHLLDTQYGKEKNGERIWILPTELTKKLTEFYHQVIQINKLTVAAGTIDNEEATISNLITLAKKILASLETCSEILRDLQFSSKSPSETNRLYHLTQQTAHEITKWVLTIKTSLGSYIVVNDAQGIPYRLNKTTIDGQQQAC